MKGRPATARRKARPYDNRLREAQAKQTRQRILEAVTELVAAGIHEDLTIAEIARRAGVSEPTLYRHFGSREQLYEEIDMHIRRQLGLPTMTLDFERLPGTARDLFRRFGEHGTLLRAAVNSGLSRKIRAKAKVKRSKEMAEALAPHAAHLPAAEAGAVAAIYRLLLSWEAWDRLTGELGVESETASEAIAWAIDALNRKLKDDQAAGRDSIRVGDSDDDDDDNHEE